MLRALFVLSLLACSGCATVTGTVVGPVAFPISDIAHTQSVPWAARIITVPFGILIGPVYGAAKGASADYGLLKYGEYGVERRPAFGSVFDPLDVQPDWREVTDR